MKAHSIIRFIFLGLVGAALIAAGPLKAPPLKAPAQAAPAQKAPAATPAQEAPAEIPAPSPPAKSALNYFESGGSHLDQGKLDQAIADYTEAIRLKPDFLAAYLNRGTARRKKGENDQAIADYTKAIQIKADLYEAYTLRGICYGKKGKYQEAVADFTKALEKKPHYLTYLGLAWVFATSKNDKSRNGSRAVELAQKAVLFHKNSNSLKTLAAAYAESGKFKEAVETQEEALALLKQPGPVPPKELAPYERQLQAYKSNKPWRE